MSDFNDIKEMITALKREENLISEMFSKRKSLNYKYSYALKLVDYEESRLDYLLKMSVLRESDGVLEIDDQFLEFFEQVLDVNESVNLSYINDNIASIKEKINYYFNENNENRKYKYLKDIKKTLRRIGVITLKNVIDLRRNIENTFKNEANYKNKQLKLVNLDEKRTIITNLIKQTLALIKDEELTFFGTATDEELSQIIVDIKSNLSESSHNLIEIEKQIIDYLNQIKQQGRFIDKLHKLKYLKDHFLIEAETNIRQILSTRNQVTFEVRINEPTKLSIDYLRDSENTYSVIRKIAAKYSGRKQNIPLLAESISDEYLENSVEEEVMINLEEIKNQFIATSDNLFDFLSNYDFQKDVESDERVTIFCQIASQFDKELLVENEYNERNGIEFALVYPR